MSHAPRRYAIAVAGILSSLLIMEAKADFTSGNQLWDACAADEHKEPVKAMFCTTYILGAGETFQVLQVANQVRFYCVPPKVENGQVIDVVKLYLRDHPESRQYSSPTLIMIALREKFPCN
jgi:Rap1a immunity proteins